jgi:serine/threonine protein kinase
VICISWYDELFFIRVTVDTTCTYMYAYTLPPLPSLSPSHTHIHTLTHTSSELDHGLSEPQIRCIAKQMFSGLGFLHESGCIHRDLKAGNILLMPNGSIRLGECPSLLLHLFLSSLCLPVVSLSTIYSLYCILFQLTLVYLPRTRLRGSANTTHSLGHPIGQFC